MEKKKEKDLKRKRRDETGYGDKVDISDDSDDDMNSNRRQRSKKDGNNSGVALKDLGKLQGQSTQSVMQQIEAEK